MAPKFKDSGLGGGPCQVSRGPSFTPTPNAHAHCLVPVSGWGLLAGGYFTKCQDVYRISALEMFTLGERRGRRQQRVPWSLWWV